MNSPEIFDCVRACADVLRLEGLVRMNVSDFVKNKNNGFIVLSGNDFFHFFTFFRSVSVLGNYTGDEYAREHRIIYSRKSNIILNFNIYFNRVYFNRVYE